MAVQIVFVEKLGRSRVVEAGLETSFLSEKEKIHAAFFVSNLKNNVMLELY